MTEKRSKEGERIYLDYASSTPVSEEVLLAMEPYWNKVYGNAGSVHAEGVEAKRALDGARSDAAAVLNARAPEIIFTSGGTESNNLALFGVVEKERKLGRAYSDMHIVTSAIEHPSILWCLEELERRGVSVSYVSVDERGVIDPKEIRKELKENTVLVSIMYANNEIGTIQPLAEIAKVIRVFKKAHKETPLLFHSDASQAPLYLDCSVSLLGVDLLTLDGQKIRGPKGIGLLYKSPKVKLVPLLYGGGQEKGLRPGTEPIPLIVGFVHALKRAEQKREEMVKKVTLLRNYFIENLKKEIPTVILNGDPLVRIANNVNVLIPGISGIYFVVLLDNKGIACGTRSACMNDDDEASYVLRALGRNDEETKSSLRFSLGSTTTKEEIDHTVKILKELVEKFDA